MPSPSNSASVLGKRTYDVQNTLKFFGNQPEKTSLGVFAALDFHRFWTSESSRPYDHRVKTLGSTIIKVLPGFE
jgi:hypothetical protein